MKPFDNGPFTAVAATVADLRAGDGESEVSALSRRQTKLCKRLAKFDLVEIVEILAGLLTHPDNHCATPRIEALIHLAVLHCRGTQKPTLLQIREWLNDILLSDALGIGEDRVEDVFATVVPSPSGSAILLEGAWRDSAFCLQNMMAALLRLMDEPWAASAMANVMALLQLARKMAEKAGIQRYEMTTVGPQQKIKVTPERVELTRRAVQFSFQDIIALHVVARDIAPFVLDARDYGVLASENLSHSSLERYPLIRKGNNWLVALPTAIGVAARRFILEKANDASALPRYEDALRAVELQEIYHRILPGWEMTNASGPVELSRNVHVIETQFDKGAYALIVHLSDDLNAALGTGLNGMEQISVGICEALSRLEREVAARADYRRGLTVFVRGGAGRGYTIDLDRSPIPWHRADLDLGDAARMARDIDFTGKRIWKLLSRKEEIASEGNSLVNFGGFLNFYGYLRSQHFDFLPAENTTADILIIPADFEGQERARIRKAIDYHLTFSPTGRTLIEVERRSTASFFKEVETLPLFIAPQEAVDDMFMAVTETARRPWWVEYRRTDNDRPELTLRIWDAAQQWLVRLARLLEADLASLPDWPVSFVLDFPDIADLDDSLPKADEKPQRPRVRLVGGVVHITSTVPVLRGYVNASNIAERYLIAAMAMGASEFAGVERSLDWADLLASRVVGTDEARFVHAIPAEDIPQMLLSAVPMPKPRFWLEEDHAWSVSRLARRAGTDRHGVVPAADVKPLLHSTVAFVWARIKARLETINRRSIVELAILNHEAIDKDRFDWKQTAAALLSLHRDQENVLLVHNEREAKRAASSVASRALAEMAICTSPVDGGRSCSAIDFDELLADTCAMIDCATQSDAYYYGLAKVPLEIARNGSFIFDRGFLEELHLPYMYAQGDRAFHDAAEAYGAAFAQADSDESNDDVPDGLDPDLNAAIYAEFGMSIVNLIDLSQVVAARGLEQRTLFLVLRKSETLAILREVGADVDAERAYEALTLLPRPVWNDPHPVRGSGRDWQPWRMNRRLSLTRRPWIQITEDADPEMLLFPILTSRVIRRIFDVVDGRLGSEMFDTKEIDRWIGKVVNERGHAFNHAVAASLRRNGFDAQPDQLMTLFGADKKAGDIDVLAWKIETKEVWIIECKRLLLDRTVAEVGDRLADYTTAGKRNGKRTPIQKHLDRVAFLKKNPGPLGKLTGLDPDRLILRSALITDRIVPMQFAKSVDQLVDRVCNFRKIDDVFGHNR